MTSLIAKLRHPKQMAQGHRNVWAAVTIALVLAGALASVLGARAVARSDADKTRLAFTSARDREDRRGFGVPYLERQD